MIKKKSKHFSLLISRKLQWFGQNIKPVTILTSVNPKPQQGPVFNFMNAKRAEESTEENFEASGDWFMGFKEGSHLHNTEV